MNLSLPPPSLLCLEKHVVPGLTGPCGLGFVVRTFLQSVCDSHLRGETVLVADNDVDRHYVNHRFQTTL